MSNPKSGKFRRSKIPRDYGGSIHNVGRCQQHGKVLFTSRDEAKKAIRRCNPDEHKQAYRCGDEHPDLWHVGQIPYGKLRGMAQSGDRREYPPAAA